MIHFILQNLSQTYCSFKATTRRKNSYALNFGQRIFGENKLQDALKRWTDFLKIYQDIELHYIGHLQTNKVKKALNFFDVIHTLDRRNLALEISKNLTPVSKTKSFLIQVNTGNEKSKSGISLDDFEDFFKYVISLNIPVKGLMCFLLLTKSLAFTFAF